MRNLRSVAFGLCCILGGVFLANFGAEAGAQQQQTVTEARNLSTTMGHSSGLIREQSPVWWGSGWAG